MSNANASVVAFREIYEDELSYVKQRRFDLIKEQFEVLIIRLSNNTLESAQKTAIESEISKTIESIIRNINEDGSKSHNCLIKKWCNDQIKTYANYNNVVSSLNLLKKVLEKEEDCPKGSNHKYQTNKEFIPNVDKGLTGLCFSGGRDQIRYI